MGEAASRELRNNTRSLLERVESGETITITLDGRPVAELRAPGRRPRWMSRQEFAQRIASRQADAALAEDLAELAPDSTRDLPSL